MATGDIDGCGGVEDEEGEILGGGGTLLVLKLVI